MGRSAKFLSYPIWYRRGRKAGESVYLRRDEQGQLGLENRV